MKLLQMIGFILFLSCSMSVVSTEIEVFTASYIQPVRYPGHSITYYALDAPDRMNEMLPKFTGVNETQARKEAMAWLQRYGNNFADALKASAEGRTKALEYQVEKVPAVVFDQGKYVVYGTTNIRRALLIREAEKNR